MNATQKLLSLALVSVVMFATTGCKDDEQPEPVIATTINDLPADPATSFDPNSGQPTGYTNKFTFFSFKTGAQVDHADSATTKWDLAFRSTTIIVNSGTSGPGTAQAQIVDGIFDELAEAPADGYKSDDDVSPIGPPPNTSLAIATGSGKGWYTYDGPSQVNKPTAGKVFLVKTSDGRYVKMEILSYYKGAPATPTFNNEARYYTFRYVYQPNETRSFK